MSRVAQIFGIATSTLLCMSYSTRKSGIVSSSIRDQTQKPIASLTATEMEAQKKRREAAMEYLAYPVSTTAFVHTPRRVKGGLLTSYSQAITGEWMEVTTISCDV